MMPRGMQGRRRNGLESEGKGSKNSKRKQASGTDSIGLYCRCSRMAFLVPRTRPTPHDLDDVDPQCHLIRTPTPDEAFSPASWPSYTRLDRDAVSSLNRMVRRRVNGLGASSLGSRWLAPVKLVDPSRYGYLVPVRLLVSQFVPSEWTGIPSTGSISKGGQR